MKVTFPHMGNIYIAVKVLLDTLEIDYCIPPVGSRTSLEKGILNSPEFMCLPFKTILGNFISGLEDGADVILFGGGCGQCRQSYYGNLQQEILKSLGYKFTYIPINFYNISYRDFFEKLSPLMKGKSRIKIAKAVTAGLHTVFKVDALYAFSNKIRCRELVEGSVDVVMKKFEKDVQKESGFINISKAINTAKEELKKIELKKNYHPIKVLLVGEIFLLSDHFTNLEIERKLGQMGVEVTNTMGVSTWIRHHFIKRLIPIKKQDKSIKLAHEYIHTNDIGGHGIHTVGNAVIGSRKGYDGIIQIYPFTCMPEIIAECTFDEIREKYDVPIMTLILDEMTGEAGYVTRLEAFADMLFMKRENIHLKPAKA
ncbi:MAG: hypothetical protein N2171_01130 [Clostridia bacterium]|nr:hypothetical protein [Clostridia bacterium]